MKILGKKLKMKRIEMDVTQKQLSQACNIAVGTISAIEKHNKPTNIKILSNIASFLGVEINYFIEE